MSNKSRGNILVIVQFVLLAVIFFAPRTQVWRLPMWASVAVSGLFVAGVIIAVLGVVGLGASLTANPVPREKATLKTRGLFAAVRHPIYSGILLASLAFALRYGSLWSAVGAIALVVLFAFKARFEERMLLDTYPAYAEYAARVGRFIPWVGRLKAPVKKPAGK